MTRTVRIVTTPADEAETLWRELNQLRRRAQTAQEWAEIGVLVQLNGIAFQRALLWRMGSLEGAIRALREQAFCKEADEVIG